MHLWQGKSWRSPVELTKTRNLQNSENWRGKSADLRFMARKWTNGYRIRTRICPLQAKQIIFLETLGEGLAPEISIYCLNDFLWFFMMCICDFLWFLLGPILFCVVLMMFFMLFGYEFCGCLCPKKTKCTSIIWTFLKPAVSECCFSSWHHQELDACSGSNSAISCDKSSASFCERAILSASSSHESELPLLAIPSFHKNTGFECKVLRFVFGWTLCPQLKILKKNKAFQKIQRNVVVEVKNMQEIIEQIIIKFIKTSYWKTWHSGCIKIII